MIPRSEIRSTMLTLRTSHGADTPIGRRCSNVIELLDELPPPAEQWIDYLMSDTIRAQLQAGDAAMRKQLGDIQQLLSKAKEAPHE